MMRCLCLLLLSALGARPGDIIRGDRSKGMECLTWWDVVIELKQQPDGTEVFWATITMRFTENKR